VWGGGGEETGNTKDPKGIKRGGKFRVP